MLDADIYGLPHVLVAEAEIARIIGDTVGQSQVREQSLELVEEVIINEAVVVLD